MQKKLPPVFFEMLQSFVALAKNLNLSKTVDELGTTRQTIRRHIRELETLSGESFLVLRDRKYVLTSAGERALATAEELLGKAEHWLIDRDKFTRGLRSASIMQENDVPFYAQRHPLLNIWEMAPPLLKKGLGAWSKAQGQIENEAFDIISDYMVIYRQHKDDWICARIGEKSSYATWLGWSWAKSAVGTNFFADPISSKSDDFIIEAYKYTARTGGVWYDHVSTLFPRVINGELAPVNYQRLIFACIFPNGEPAVASLVARTNNISIDGIGAENIAFMQDSDLMEFDV